MRRPRPRLMLHDAEDHGAGRLGLLPILAGPALAIGAHLLLPGTLGAPARVTAALAVWMAVWWITEAIPLPVTALLPLIVLPAAGATGPVQAASPYADRFIFLFMGGFMLALAMEKHNLHRRLALHALRVGGVRPRRLIGAFMVATAALSMWVSNTATAAMMIPIAISVASFATARYAEPAHVAGARNFGTCLTLGVAYGASIGGVATLIGSPPNALLAGYLETTSGRTLGFLEWMLFAAPLSAITLALSWLLLVRVTCPVRLPDLQGGREMLDAERRALGPMSSAEKGVLAVFALTALAWVVRQPLSEWPWLVARAPIVTRLDDPMIAVAAAIALFALPLARDGARGRAPLLDWKTASRLPWGVLLLFGGGLSLASAMKSTGLDVWVGSHLHGLHGLPIVVVILALVAGVTFLSEVASNTAVAAAFLPIAGAAAVAIGEAPMTLAAPAALASSLAFMLPVGTPPNAIAFATGRVTIRQMARTGLALNVLAIALVTVWTLLVGPIVFG